MRRKSFIEFSAPRRGVYSNMGWYVSAHEEPYNYYIHEDGNVYDFCYDEHLSSTSGWFKTKEELVIIVDDYYVKHGLIYTYGNLVNNSSKVMEF